MSEITSKIKDITFKGDYVNVVFENGDALSTKTEYWEETKQWKKGEEVEYEKKDNKYLKKPAKAKFGNKFSKPNPKKDAYALSIQLCIAKAQLSNDANLLTSAAVDKVFEHILNKIQ